MQGDAVIVRAYGGVPLVRRVWDENERVVYITNDSRLKQMLAGDTEIWPVGFPREDVFKFDQELASQLETLCESGKWDWNKLDPF